MCQAGANVWGTGFTPEGIDQNPVYYEFMLEANWRTKCAVVPRRGAVPAQMWAERAGVPPSAALPCVQSPPTVYPCRRTTLGASIIATGQSGADNYMSIAHHDYKRLGAWLGDSHFAAFGSFLEAATTQVTDWDGSLGYAARGLMTEATTLSVRRGSGVQDWLPWLTANILQPLVQDLRQQRGRIE